MTMELPDKSGKNENHIEKQWVPNPRAFRLIAEEKGIPVRTLYSAYRMFHKFEEAVSETTGFLLLDANHPAFLYWLEKDYSPFQPEKPNCWVCGKPVPRARAKFCSNEHMYQWNKETGFYGDIGRQKKPRKPKAIQPEPEPTHPIDQAQSEA